MYRNPYKHNKDDHYALIFIELHVSNHITIRKRIIFYSLVHSWEIKCCSLEDWCHRDCFLTEFVNVLTQPMDHTADEEGKSVLTGLFSKFTSADM